MINRARRQSGGENLIWQNNMHNMAISLTEQLKQGVDVTAKAAYAPLIAASPVLNLYQNYQVASATYEGAWIPDDVIIGNLVAALQANQKEQKAGVGVSRVPGTAKDEKDKYYLAVVVAEDLPDNELSARLVFNYINDYREEKGLAALLWSDSIQEAALAQTEALAAGTETQGDAS